MNLIVLADAWGEDCDIQGIHRQHQGQDWQGSGVLPSIGEREGACKTQRSAHVAQVGLWAGAWSCQRDHFVHPEPGPRKKEDTGRCKKRKRQEVMGQTPRSGGRFELGKSLQDMAAGICTVRASPSFDSS